MNYGFIGFGNLAKAIYQGLKDDKEINFGYISKSNKYSEIRSFENFQKLVSFADVIWLCVKPQNLAEVLSQLKGKNLKNKLLVSPVAGKNLEFIEKYTGKDVAIMRIMPNLAIAYGKSVTAYCFNEYLSKNNNSLKLASKLKGSLSNLGKTVDLAENHFDLFTAIFGSGPAFLLEILKVFQKKIEELKIPDTQVNDVLTELLAGTLIYLQKNKETKSIEELVQTITSKGGTTEAGLKYFKAKEINKLFEDVIETARIRSEEINN